MDNTQKDHPLSSYSILEKKAYLVIVASMASADRDVSDEEINNLRALCKRVCCDARTMGEVLGAAEDPSSVPIVEYITLLKTSELRFTLLTDMLFLAHADREYSDEERSLISRIALELGIGREQIDAIEAYVLAINDYRAFTNENGLMPDVKDLTADVTAGLAAAGVPIAAVAVSGSVWGLSSAGIISGLTALGLGLGMTTGIGVVAVLGVVSYYAVRWLYRNLTERSGQSPRDS